MMLLLIFNFSISFPLGIFGSFMQAYEKFIVTKVVSIVRSIIIPFITLPLLFLGYESVSIVVVSTIVNIVCLLFNVYYCMKYLKIKFQFVRLEFGLLREIAGYSFFIFLNVIVDKVYWSTDQFILGIVSGTVPVAIYAVAMQFITLYMMFSTSISGVFLPKLSMMVANNARNVEFTDLFIKVGRMQYIILAYILIGFILFGKSFINLWVGNDYNNAFYICVSIMIPLLIPLIQNLGISILQAKNIHAFRSVVYITVAIVKLLVSIPLAMNLGGIGSAIATAISLIIGNIIIMNIYYHRKIGLDILLFWKNISLVSIPMALSIIIGLIFNSLILYDEILFLVLKILVFSIFYITLLYFLGFNKEEKDIINSIFRRGLRKIER
jgi:O-antigen/teichoic acid export membrane protein